jgi:putative peptide zinc metalloprotease protein
MEESIAYLSRKLPLSIAGSKTDEFDEEKTVIKWYSLLFISGTIITLLLCTFYFIPQLIYTLNRAYHSLQYPFGTLEFWDGMMVTLQVVFISILLVYSWMKSLKITFLKHNKN